MSNEFPTVGRADATPMMSSESAEFPKWEPDDACLVAGDKYVLLALRCYAAAGLWDEAIDGRLLRQIGFAIEAQQMRHTDAAVALARHGAGAGVSVREIAVLLAQLAGEVPCWPDDPAAIAAIARAAVAEMAP